jgi:flagellin
VLDGSLGTKSFQVGADVGQTISVSLQTSVKTSDIGKVAEVNSGDISSTFAGLTVDSANGSGLTVAIGSGSAVNVADGVYHSASDLAAAINKAAGSDVATVNASGELSIDNSAGASGITFGGGDATTIGLTTVAAGASGASTGTADAVGDLSQEGFSVNGTSIDLSGVKSLQDLSDAINAAGVDGVSVAVSADGKGLQFYSSGSLSVTDTGGNLLGTDAKNVNSGAAFSSGDTATVGGSLATGSVKTVDAANDLISRVDVALKSVSDFAAQLGAVQNRFQSTISTVAAQTTNLQSSQSTIQDADFAAETASLSKAQVLQQAGISVLAQANSNPQQVLKLLQ